MSPGEVLHPGVVVGCAEHDDGTGVELVVGPVHHGLVTLTVKNDLHLLSQPDNNKLYQEPTISFWEMVFAFSILSSM